MMRRGHRVGLICPRSSRIFSEARRFGVPVTALPIARRRPVGIVALARFLATHPVNVVNTHSSIDSWLVALACRSPWVSRARRPALVRTRHLSVPVPHDMLTRWLYTRATAEIVTTGESIRQQLIRGIGVAPERATSIPTGVDPKRYSPRDKAASRHTLGLPEDVPLVGIVATLRSWKGHRFLVEAMPLLARRNAQLLIIGDGPQRDALERQIAELGLSSRVWLTGNQSNVVPWLAALDVFALPSYANEGVPQALIQAMHLGIPCVTTDAGAIGEIAIHDVTALVVSKQNAVALAGAIDRLLGDPALCARLAWSGRERALAKFSLEAMLDRMEAVFRRATNANRRP